MSRLRVQQTSLITGIISPTLYGRTDLQRYYNGLDEAENVVIMPHGGVQRRSGLKYLVEVEKGARLFSFEFSIDQNYIFVIGLSEIKIYKPNDNVLLATLTFTTPLIDTQLRDMDIIQSADTVIITHEDFKPKMIQRQGSDTSWLIQDVPLTNIPKFDFDVTKTAKYFNFGETLIIDLEIGDIVYDYKSKHNYKSKLARPTIDLSKEAYTTDTTNWDDLGVRPDVWGDTGGALTDRGWPRTCTFHQGRLWFGGSKFKPTSVWGSVVKDFFNFDTGKTDVKEDDAVFNILDTEQYNAINNIISGTKLQVLTASGEFVNTEPIITPTKSSWNRYTSYGAKRLKNVVLDGATYFMDRYGKTLRLMLYNNEEGGYVTQPISILAEHIIKGVVDIGIIRGSETSISNLIYLVNGDGTIAVFNTMRREDIQGWTKWTTKGKFKRVTITQSVVSFIVEREDGREYLEVLDEDVLVDHAFVDNDTDKVEIDDLLYTTPDDIRVVFDTVVSSNITPVNEGGKFFMYADKTSKVVYSGYNYNVIVKTLPVAAMTQSVGNIVNLPKRVVSCEVVLYQSLGVYVDGNYITPRTFDDKLDTKIPLKTKPIKVFLLGYNKRNQVEITQKNPETFTLLSLDLEINY